jgi:hypothetical protein
MGLVTAVATMLPGVERTINEAALFPLGVKETIALAFNATALILLGIKGKGTGLTAIVGSDATDFIPNIFAAVTVNVYAVPFVKPVTIIGLDMLDAEIPPGEEVTVYLPPLPVKDTVTCVSPSTTVTLEGVSGIVTNNNANPNKVIIPPMI